MPTPLLDSILQNGQGPFLASAVAGGLLGSLIGGIASGWAAYAFARRMFRNRVLDHARKEIKAPMGAYMEWLTQVSGEFAVWKTELLPSFLADSSQDQFQLNRMRKLFVDQRNSLWLARVEEYDAILPDFAPAIKAMWIRQTEIGETFDRVFRNLEADPPEAVQAGERIETLSFEQGQLVSDFLYQLQYECLRDVARRKPKVPRDVVKPRIVRTSFGRVRMVTPKEY
jgi:hypothetical protein